MLVAVFGVERSKGREQERERYQTEIEQQVCLLRYLASKGQRGGSRNGSGTKQKSSSKRSNTSMGVDGKRKEDCTAFIEGGNYLFSKFFSYFW